MTTNNDTNNFLTCPIAKIGDNTGARKSAIPEDIYEAVCIGVADAGKSESTWQGKTKMQQNAVIVWQIDFINGFGSQCVITDWVKPSAHENSRWTKEFITPSKLKLTSMGDLVGKTVRVEIGMNPEGFPTILRYFASKKPIEVADGIYLPAWLYTKGYPLVKHSAILDGARPKAETVAVAPKATPTDKFPAAVAKKVSAETPEEEGELPF